MSEPNQIIIAGASGAGKTWLLAAVERAALQNPAGQPRLSVSPRVPANETSKNVFDDGTDLFLRHAARFFLLRVLIPATIRSSHFRLNINVDSSFAANAAASGPFEIVDAPGHLMSPRDSDHPEPKDWDEWAEATKNARALVYCFDAITSNNNNAAAQLRISLEANLSRLLAFLQNAGRSIERVLFLITKADILASVFHDRYLGAVRLTPLQWAQRLDPVEQACSIVGVETISKFLHNKQWQVGIGLCSAMGFDADPRNGQPMVSPYNPLRLNLRGGRTREEHYQRWRPFGVREALLFLTKTLDSRQTHCLKILRPEDAAFRETPRAFVVPNTESYGQGR